MRRRHLFLGAIGVVFAAIAVSVWSKMEMTPSRPYASPEKIVVGTTRSFYSLPLLIAQTQGILARNGLAVEMIDYESGLLALSGLFKNEVEIATAADFVFVGESFRHQDLRILASIASSASEEVVARKDRGVQDISDLKGKRIGVTLNTSADFTLMRFLTLNRISRSEVTFINLSPRELPEAISSGKIDAMICWDTWVYEAKKRLGTDAVAWPARVGQDFYWMLGVRKGLIESRRAAVERFLKSMVQAEDFIRRHKEESLDALVREWNFDPEYTRYACERNRIDVTLEQGIVTAMEDEAEWKIAEIGSKELVVPNYLRFICFDGLAEVEPKAVRIYR
jgi:NitT/TauT family transport system substrate-binding protein